MLALSSYFDPNCLIKRSLYRQFSSDVTDLTRRIVGADRVCFVWSGVSVVTSGRAAAETVTQTLPVRLLFCFGN